MAAIKTCIITSNYNKSDIISKRISFVAKLIMCYVVLVNVFRL